MKVLAIDTSTARLTVAYGSASDLRELTAGELTGGHLHGERLAGLVREILAGDTPDLVAVGCGPGPYTGLRAGLVTAEVLAAAWQVPVTGVSSLAAIAHGHRRRGGGGCAAVLDVKRREVAWQPFDGHGLELLPPQLSSINDMTELLRYPVVGPAFVSQRLVSPDVADASPVSAVDVAWLAMAQDRPLPVAPLYLRAPDAAEPKPPKSVSNG